MEGEALCDSTAEGRCLVDLTEAIEIMPVVWTVLGNTVLRGWTDELAGGLRV